MRPEAGDDIDDLRRLVTQAYRASDGGEQVAGTGDPVKERRRSRSSIVRQWVAVVRRLIGCLPSSPVYERDASPSQQVRARPASAGPDAHLMFTRRHAGAHSTGHLAATR